MSKLFTIIIILILIGVVGYVYYKNTSDIGIQIERLKLKFAIGPNSDPDSLLSFSKAIGALQTSDEKQRNIIEFEKYYYYALAENKTATKYLVYAKGTVFSVNCNFDEDFKTSQISIADAKEYINAAESTYLLAKSSYLIDEQEFWENSISALKDAINTNENIFYIACPIK